MRKSPSKSYETHPNGRLHGMKNVYVADGSVFPALPAKNLSFTIMANAMRVAAGLFQNVDRCVC
jgi:choline dehydrogenase-like flavoprotein